MQVSLLSTSTTRRPVCTDGSAVTSGGFSFRTLNYGPASGGADGSLLLSDIEISRSENNPMQGFREKLLKKYDLYKGQGVGAADLIQVAAAIAIKSCPGGPVIKTVSSLHKLIVTHELTCTIRSLGGLTIVLPRQKTIFHLLLAQEQIIHLLSTSSRQKALTPGNWQLLWELTPFPGRSLSKTMVASLMQVCAQTNLEVVQVRGR